MGTRRRRRTADRGASAVEFAIIVPLVLLVLFEVIGWGYMFSFRQALSQAADEGARAAVGATLTGCGTTGTWDSSCDAQVAATTAINNTLSNYSYGGVKLACGAAGVTCTIGAATTCASGHRCVSVVVNYPYRSQPLLGGLPTNVGPFNVVLPPNLSFTSIVQVS